MSLVPHSPLGYDPPIDCPAGWYGEDYPIEPLIPFSFRAEVNGLEGNLQKRSHGQQGREPCELSSAKPSLAAEHEAHIEAVNMQTVAGKSRSPTLTRHIYARAQAAVQWLFGDHGNTSSQHLGSILEDALNFMSRVDSRRWQQSVVWWKRSSVHWQLRNNISPLSATLVRKTANQTQKPYL